MAESNRRRSVGTPWADQLTGNGVYKVNAAKEIEKIELSMNIDEACKKVSDRIDYFRQKIGKERIENLFIGLSSINTMTDGNDFSTWSIPNVHQCYKHHKDQSHCTNTLIVVATVTGPDHRGHTNALKKKVIEDQGSKAKEERYHLHHDSTGRPPSGSPVASAIFMTYGLGKLATDSRGMYSTNMDSL